MVERKTKFYIPKDQLVAMVIRLQNKEPDVETEIYNTFHDKIYGHLVKRTRDTEIADELISEVFVEIFKTVHKLRKPEAFVSWTNQIVEHQVAAYFREYRREEAKEKKLAEQQRLAAQTYVEEMHIAQLLKQLPPKQARVMHLHLIDKYLIKDIADMEGIPEGTVKSRLYYGRKALKELLIDRTD